MTYTVTQKVSDVALAKESFWQTIYIAAIQGIAPNVGMGTGVTTACDKALMLADRAVEQYAERWLGEKPQRAKPARPEGHHGHARETVEH